MAPEIPHDQPSIESPLSGERLDFLATSVADSPQADAPTPDAPSAKENN